MKITTFLNSNFNSITDYSQYYDEDIHPGIYRNRFDICLMRSLG